MLGDSQIPKFRPFVGYNGEVMPEKFQNELLIWHWGEWMVSFFLGSVLLSNMLISIMGQDFDQFLDKWEGFKYQSRAYFLYEILLAKK